jgi:hypothetical protein
MSPTDAPTWWADVQQEREDLTGLGAHRDADDWLGEDIDFVPRRRITGDRSASASAVRRGAEHDLHGVFIPSPSASASARTRGRAALPAAGSSVVIELDASTPAPVPVASDVTHALGRLSAADDPFSSPPPPPGTRRTVQIRGRPGEGTVTSMARRHRPRTASDRVGPRPDRIALWVVVLGAILILLAATSSSSQAAPVAPVAPAAQVVVVTPAAPAPLVP